MRDSSVSSPGSKPVWFDAHLDLAMLAELGRDMESPAESCGTAAEPAAVTFPSLCEGRVTHALGTIFTEADGPVSQSISYPAGDAEAANAAGLRQLKRYEEWYRPHFYRRLAAAGLSHEATKKDRHRATGDDQHSGEQPVRATAAEPETDPRIAPELLVLIEGADPILEPADLGEWRERGVVAVGMAWWKPSRYAGGNGTDLGITDLGRELVKEMDRLGVVHDASHLSDHAFWELTKLTDRPIIASHSNCRALMGGGNRGENQRHLDDDQIREIVRRDGIIGINLYSKFLRPLADDDQTTRATIADCIAHIEHICRIAGDRRQIGRGTRLNSSH